MKKIIKTIVATLATFIPTLALATESIEVVEVGNSSPFNVPAIAIASALCIGLASFGGAIAQGKVAQAAMEGISRNPDAASKVMTPMIIALALIESLVIYALVVAFLLQGQL